MCGIAGLLDLGCGDRDALLETAARMIEWIRHRGPDGAGVWADPACGLALGHCRLAVVDLSDFGRQPMESVCGRWIAVLNGEIYNFRALREELQKFGHRFRGRSDTEVMLASVRQWGLSGALSRFIGMFAFALWDRLDETLTLVRDRVGEKPLYYGTLGRTVVFASDLGALRGHPAGAPDVDPNAVAAYVRFGYVPAPHSIYSNIRKLPPGCTLTITRNGDVGEPAPYWSMEAITRAGLDNQLTCSAEAAADQLESLITEVTALQAFADVPVGAFLSGGIDSATIVAMLCRHHVHPRTFTVGFSDKRFDESQHARAVAERLGTEHTEIRVTPADAMSVIPELPAAYTEPFADSSQIPTFLVSQFARKHVTVALSGDGGDELFGGYNRYCWADRIWRSIRPAPPVMRAFAARALSAVPPSTLDRFCAVFPDPLRVRHAGDKLHKVSDLLSAAGANDVYLRLISHWADPNEIVRGGAEPPILLSTFLSDQRDFKRRMMLADALTYLPDDILVKLDRAAMANSLESRSPLLDHRVIEFATRLPRRLLFRNGQGKWLLRKVLHRHVPPALVDRPKAGFAIPLDAWVRGPLRGWAEDLLAESRIRSEGVFEPEPIRTKWREHLSGARNWIAPLWVALMFQAWRASHRPAPRRESTRELVIAAKC